MRAARTSVNATRTTYRAVTFTRPATLSRFAHATVNTPLGRGSGAKSLAAPTSPRPLRLKTVSGRRCVQPSPFSQLSAALGSRRFMLLAAAARPHENGGKGWSTVS